MKEDSGNYGPVSVNSVPGKAMEKVILGATEGHRIMLLSDIVDMASSWQSPPLIKFDLLLW